MADKVPITVHVNKELVDKVYGYVRESSTTIKDVVSRGLELALQELRKDPQVHLKWRKWRDK